MKCPKCGASNGRTNRFCRMCGESLISSGTAFVAQQESNLREDVEVGEVLFEVWQQYERGELAEALKKIEPVLQKYPDSTSAHSILALIYERMADIELRDGNLEASQRLLRRAIERYEKILSLNPKSAADREKITSLKLRLRDVPNNASDEKYSNGIVSAFKTMPPIVWGIGAFLIVAVFILVFTMDTGKKNTIASANGSNVINENGLPSVPKPPPVNENTQDTKLKIHVFRAGANQMSSDEDTPMSVEGSTNPTTNIIQEPEKTVQKTPKAKESVPAKTKTDPVIGPVTVKTPNTPSKNIPNVVKNTEDKPEPPKGRVDGNTLLAQAIEMHKQEKIDDAIETARDAMELFNNDIKNDINVDAARRGAAIAKKYIELWSALKKQ